MGTPTQKHTKSRRDKRRFQLRLTPQQLSTCPKCGRPRLSHTACLYCGTYKGREVVDVLKRLSKKEKKVREKELAAKEPASAK
ncbi:50S ribosomal protein L32 [Candidatus Parcubacteria bacterium]|nr:50S ribosomal protein L32 [Candidatus Parcubacteria bacterium]